jgi:sulfur transfer protein SufE
MELINLNKLVEHAKTLTTPDAQAVWVRAQSKYCSASSIVKDMSKFVPGCEHPTWMDYEVSESGINFMISADGSDSQGVAGIVVQALNGLNVQEIRNLNFSEFRNIARYLNNRQQRTLNAMLNRIKDTIGDPK